VHENIQRTFSNVALKQGAVNGTPRSQGSQKNRKALGVLQSGNKGPKVVSGTPKNKPRTGKKKIQHTFELEHTFGRLGGLSDADMVCDVQSVDLEGLMDNCCQNIPGFSDALDAQGVAAKTDAFLANPVEEPVEFSMAGERPSASAVLPLSLPKTPWPPTHVVLALADAGDLMLPELDADLGFDLDSIDLGGDDDEPLNLGLE